LAAYTLQDPLTFFRSNLIFSLLSAILLHNQNWKPTKKIISTTMADPTPPPRLHDILPHKVTKGEINIAHVPQSSPVQAAKAPLANLFGNLHGFPPLNKHPSSPRETTGLTPARKKHGGTTRRASSVKARAAIQELLAAELSSLHIEDLFDGCAESSDLHWTIVTPDGGNALHESDNDDHHPESVVSIVPPQRQHYKVHKKTSKPKLVIDRKFVFLPTRYFR
jgi:hypothetical protein